MVGAVHPIIFRGLHFDAGSGRPLAAKHQRPVLVERTDEDFLEAFLEELSSDAGRKLLAGSVLNAGEPAKELLKLNQPVHRSFHLAVFEAACDTFGEPRLDPSRIESAGLVVRRLDSSGKSEGWMKLGSEVRGWMPLRDKAELERDPDPARRKEPLPGAPARINALLKNLPGASEAYEESVSLLFVAPPHVCAAAGRTILYGLVPVASAERVSSRLTQPPQYEQDDLERLLSPYFVGDLVVNLQGIAGKTYSARYSDDLRRDEVFASNEGARAQAEKQLDDFAMMLRMLVSVFNAFEHPELREALNRIWLDYGNGTWKRMGDELAVAAEVFVFERDWDETNKRPLKFELPRSWPRLSESDFSALMQAAAKAAASRISSTQLGNALPQRGRFDVIDAQYEVLGFIRVRRDDGCPPAIVWSNPSQPFKIAAWYDSGKLPPVQVALPPVTRDNVKNFKPNVAFLVPGNIFDLVSRNKPKDFLEQKAKLGNSGGVDWLCAFNIPIIMLCAFIVLSIFLALLNILFWWLPLIKICIPLPRGRRPSTP